MSQSVALEQPELGTARTSSSGTALLNRSSGTRSVLGLLRRFTEALVLARPRSPTESSSDSARGDDPVRTLPESANPGREVGAPTNFSSTLCGADGDRRDSG